MRRYRRLALTPTEHHGAPRILAVLFGVLLVALLAMDALAQERDTGTAFDLEGQVVGASGRHARASTNGIMERAALLTKPARKGAQSGAGYRRGSRPLSRPNGRVDRQPGRPGSVMARTSSASSMSSSGSRPSRSTISRTLLCSFAEALATSDALSYPM